jgi:hypothetical protein
LSSISARDSGEALADDHDPRAKLLRRFEAAIAGAELGDLRQLANDLTGIAARRPKRLVRPELRRAPRDEVAIYRVRVNLGCLIYTQFLRIYLRFQHGLLVICNRVIRRLRTLQASHRDLTE